MEYFHVLLETSNGAEKGKIVEAFKDLSKKELKSRFIKPFRKGNDFIIEGQKYPYDRIHAVRICMTEKTNEEIRDASYEASIKRVEKLNSQHDNPLYFVFPCTPSNEDIFNFGKDVTSSYDLSRKSSSIFSAAFERVDRVVFSILAIVVAGILLYYFGLK